MNARPDGGWRPAAPRARKVSSALQAYAALTTSAARGAVRDVTQLTRPARNERITMRSEPAE
jgi:dihydroxy-acid dehydratase